MSYLLSSRHVFVRSGSSQVFVRLPGGWSDDARYLSDTQHAAEGWVYVRPLPHTAPETPDA